MTMDLVEELQLRICNLPPLLAREVLDFIGYLEHTHRQNQERDPLKHAQLVSMRKVWDNPTDDAWNDI